ncbi:MAG: M3 family oligoendopeptidase [Deltaproteobacteria bacterium]|nr:M3 family oligoendopeptidase [Deltaproteobacteria bacterium]
MTGFKELDGAQGIKWDLSDLYGSPEDPSITEDLRSSADRAKQFQEMYKGKEIASLEPPAFFPALKEYESIQEAGVKPFLYASLLFSEDTQDNRYKALLQQAKERWNELENQFLFFRLALIGLPEERLHRLLEYEPLQVYEHALRFLRRFRDFTRPEKEEEILNRKNLTGRSAITTLFDEFTGSFTFRLTVDGVEKEFTGSGLLAMLYSPDRNLREKAFSAFLKHHEQNNLVLTSIFNALILDSRVEDEIRGYRGPMHRTHLENEIPPETVDLMMEATENHYSLAREYFQVKTCLLGLPRMKNSDLYAPLPGGNREMSFEKAKSLLVESFHRFHPRFGEISQEFFEKRWIDAELRKGKYGGAFCSGMTPSLHPYLLMNFTGNFRDALTLAHEMGHAIHSYLSRKQTLLNFDPPLTLAETASVFGEMIMIQELLQEEQDVAARQAILCAALEDIIATVFRQNVLTRFEQEAHERRRNHLLTGEEIGDIWWQANARLFGDSVEMIPEYRWGWSYISHFIHARFYCYSYVFGELVVLALFQKYQEEGSSFLPLFIRLLESGGSRRPDELLAEVGMYVNQPAFWEKGFQVIRGLIDELKSLGPWDRICTEGDGQ